MYSIYNDSLSEDDAIPPLEQIVGPQSDPHPFGPVRTSSVRRRRRRRRRLFADSRPVLTSIDSSSSQKRFVDTGTIIGHYVHIDGINSSIKFHFGGDMWIWESLILPQIKEEYYLRIGTTRAMIYLATLF